MADRILETRLLTEKPHRLLELAGKLREFHSRFSVEPSAPPTALTLIDSGTFDLVDPLLSQWALTGAIALEKLYASAAVYSRGYRFSSLDGISRVCDWSAIADANKEIVLHQLGESDLLGLDMLDRLTKLPPAATTWRKVSGLNGDIQRDIPVSPERQAQIEAFEEIAAEIRSNKVLQHNVFSNIKRAQSEAAEGYPR